ncbi:type VI secretion system protein TssA [Caballeronia sp. LZ065]|uniref:type VI secretion system protein TssA n=1 Tax=Caballeronia sp. LZ065 TaxID=3038571 RepID=UPI00285810E1|nr:type VI secretion system protein TssA [Caballeronia sp. LZ065]MDR5784945.1 type VI secretion system protein TssA [Caballeronia sp. LZ065]
MNNASDSAPDTEADPHDGLLLEPVTDQAPCGDELTYDQAFIDLERLAVGKTEQQFGSTIIPAENPDWHQVAVRASGLLKRTKDLRVATLLTRAWVQLHGLAGYGRGVALIAGLLERYWQALHPHVETDGESDPLMRINALRNLGDPETIGRAIRNATILRVKQGSLSLRDAAALLDGHASQAAASLNLDGAELRQQLALAANAPNSLTALIPEILAALKRIAQTVQRELGDAWVPDFRSVEAPLRLIGDAAQPLRGHVADAPLPFDDQDAPHEAIADGPSHRPAEHAPDRVHHALRSRSDVIALLQKACVYMELHEPGHPAPLLIRRAVRLMGMSFYEIVRDMVPAGIAQLDVLANSQKAGEPPVQPG